MATQKLILAKDVKCPKWSFAVAPIKKGTEVEVEQHGETYTVKHPALMGILINVDKSFFTDTRKKADVKVGDEFWFVSVYNYKLWSNKVVKLTPKFATFGDGEEKYKISLFEIEIDNAPNSKLFRDKNDVVNFTNSIEIQKEGQNHSSVIGDLVKISKNKLDVQRQLLKMIEKSKADKEHAIEKLAKEHIQKMEEYAQLEIKEAELQKEINL